MRESSQNVEKIFLSGEERVFQRPQDDSFGRHSIPEGGQRLFYHFSLLETPKRQWIDVDCLCPAIQDELGHHHTRRRPVLKAVTTEPISQKQPLDFRGLTQDGMVIR